MGRTYLIFILLLLISCKDSKDPRTYRLSKDKIIQSEHKVTPTKKESFTWDVPKSWIPQDKGSVRLASYKIPLLDSFADLSITKFGGNAGGETANVNRWRKQLKLPELTESEIKASAYIGQSKMGNYSIYKISNEANLNSSFLCMILPIDDSTIFVKLNATESGIKILENEFNAFCSSFWLLK